MKRKGRFTAMGMTMLFLVACSPAASDSSPSPAPEPKANAAPAPRQAADEKNTDEPKLAEAVFAGGCFWCVEAVFEQLEGVIEAESGYSGGTAETANYKAVSTGQTGHAEAVRIIYDPAKISYEKLLEVHFATHDPTTLNRQGPDIGPHYRSAIFYADEQEKRKAQAYIAALNESNYYDKPVVTSLEKLEKFYLAEMYHQNYACNNLNSAYIRGVAMPKLDKVRERFADLMKKDPPIK